MTTKFVRVALIAVAAVATLSIAACKPKTSDEVPAASAAAPDAPVDASATMDSMAAVDAAIAASPTATTVAAGGSSGSAPAVQ